MSESRENRLSIIEKNSNKKIQDSSISFKLVELIIMVEKSINKTIIRENQDILIQKCLKYIFQIFENKVFITHNIIVHHSYSHLSIVTSICIIYNQP